MRLWGQGTAGQDLGHGGCRALLEGTMQDDQGLLGHGRVHEGMSPPGRAKPLLQIIPALPHAHDHSAAIFLM